MVIHMIPTDTYLSYIPQWKASLSPGGLMMMTDHNPMMPAGTTGPKRPIAAAFDGKFILMNMPVWPQETEVAQISALDFDVVDGPFEHAFYGGGFGAVYKPHIPSPPSPPPKPLCNCGCGGSGQCGAGCSSCDCEGCAPVKPVCNLACGSSGQCGLACSPCDCD